MHCQELGENQPHDYNFCIVKPGTRRSDKNEKPIKHFVLASSLASTLNNSEILVPESSKKLSLSSSSEILNKNIKDCYRYRNNLNYNL